MSYRKHFLKFINIVYKYTMQRSNDKQYCPPLFDNNRKGKENNETILSHLNIHILIMYYVQTMLLCGRVWKVPRLLHIIFSFCVVVCISFFRSAIVVPDLIWIWLMITLAIFKLLSDLWITASDYAFDIFQLFWRFFQSKFTNVIHNA
jgi:hypothetical protein